MELNDIPMMEAVHKGAPIDDALDILYKDISVGNLDFLGLYRTALANTNTEVSTWKHYRRAERALNLVKLFDYSLSIPGNFAECGVFRGFSAYLIMKICQMRLPDFTGGKLYLIDSFEGLSEPTGNDAIETEGNPQRVHTHGGGHFATPVEYVRTVLSECRGINIMRGWIPEVFASLPECDWAFVHIDVDLYEPSLASLEYFWPRVSSGGVILNDDHRSPLFPGGGKAWDEFCENNGISYSVLDSGQAFIIKP